jgi:hypothetical protein
VTARPWSRLLNEDPARLELELARAGTTREFLIRDVRDVAKLRQECELLKRVRDKQRREEAFLRLALEWFGDRGQPQPEKRTRPVAALFVGFEPNYGDLTPDFGRLPRLEDERPADGADEEDVPGGEGDDLVRGEPYLRADYEQAGKLHRRGLMTIGAIKKSRALKHKRAFRIYRQFKVGAVFFDDAGLHTGPGYRFDPDLLEQSPSRYKLIRR